MCLLYFFDVSRFGEEAAAIEPGRKLAGDAAWVADLACDITELLERLAPAGQAPEPMRVAYHSACSLQHGQKIRTAPKTLLTSMGFEVVEPADPHLCCGSAGTYNLLQPEISGELKRRKVATLEAAGPDVIAAGNIGCITHLQAGTQAPVRHWVEALDAALAVA